jgi:hypothetical protein
MRNVMQLDLAKKLFAFAALLIFVSALPLDARAQADGQKTFPSSESAVATFIQAVRSGDAAELLTILGPGTQELVSSGDSVADKIERSHFLARYDVKHSLIESVPQQLSLNIGPDDWPFPVPLIQVGDKWYWDGAAGKEEILYRRIGKNELSTIDVCRGVVAAQRDYASIGHDRLPAGIYAQRLFSDAGKQNGLYWQVTDKNNPSPAGPLLAQASSEGYGDSQKRSPYHGYYYRLLKAQGTNAKGGAKSYIVDGNMTRGFALLAYPADYRSSGVMTFIVDARGAIYEKDLGEKTIELAQRMTEYNPDKSWKLVK